jgi:hypothetical protein
VYAFWLLASSHQNLLAPQGCHLPSTTWDKQNIIFGNVIINLPNTSEFFYK